MSGRNVFRAAALVPAAVLALTLTGCAEKIGPRASGDSLQLAKDGQLTTCTHLPYKPFQFKEGDKIVGFDVELVDLVAKDLGVKQAITDAPFEGIQSGENLNSRDCDVAAAGMTITDERENVMDFSEPYFEATQALLVRQDSPAKDLSSLRGKTLGVQLGTTGEKYGKDRAEQNGYDVRQFEDLALLQTAVKTGQVDAGINDNGVLLDYAKSNPDTKVVTEFKTGEQYGIAVQTGNKALLNKVNDVLAKSRQDGSYEKIYRKWFGDAPQGATQ